MNLRKPKCNAVATELGWVDPVKGELLVSIKNLPNPLMGWKPGQKISMVTSPLSIPDQSVIPSETIIKQNESEVKVSAPSSKPTKQRRISSKSE